MKKLFFTLLAFAFIIACSKTEESKPEDGNQQTSINQEAPKPVVKQRYEIKSGVILYNAPMGAKQELYFDDYGAKEVFITSIDLGIAKSKTTEIRIDGFNYKFEDDKTEGIKTKWFTNDFDYSKADKSLMEEYKVKELGSETIDGKECKKYSAEFGSTPITTWIWKNIMVKSITNFSGKDMIIEATKIEETSVDPKMFELPSGVTFKEM